MREPWAGMTPALYASLTDRQIVLIYAAPRNKEGALIPESDRDTEEESEEAWQPPPLPAELGIPDKVLCSGVQMDWVRTFYQVWRGRGLTAEATTAKFWEKTKRGRT